MSAGQAPAEGAVTISVAEDARPLARALGQVLRRSAADPELGRTLLGLDGVLGLQSAKDPQRATIWFRGAEVRVDGGLSPECDVVITADLDAPSGPDSPKPGARDLAKLAKAAARRPLFAQAAAKMLEPPLPDWRTAAATFWAEVERRGGGPDALTVVCTDDGQSQRFGAADGRAPALHGPADLLSRCFVGDAVLAEELLGGNLQGHATLGEVSMLVGHAFAVMFGDLGATPAQQEEWG